ncbi:MAG TPA: LysR family transcriptional regulator [Steroidobacteraceae bacterium]|nr:LysR family transcriptional regulator [Steroidobacteraceae bacterium]
MLEDLNALVEFAAAGSVARAADRLYRTPSAVTRQIQRLEGALGATLLNRTVKPPRLTPLGARVLEQARDLLARAEALQAIASPATEPSGLLRVGVAHALADGALAGPVGMLRERFPKVRLRLISELTAELFERLRAGELDVAVALLPEGQSAPSPLETKVISTDRMLIVQPKDQCLKPTWPQLDGKQWVLNPPGCMLRATLLDTMRKVGVSATVGAEVHNMHLQLSLVASGYGLGLLPERFIRREGKNRAVRIVEPKDFDLRMAIAVVRAGSLGALERTATDFERELSALLVS